MAESLEPQPEPHRDPAANECPFCKVTGEPYGKISAGILHRCPRCRWTWEASREALKKLETAAA